MRLLYLFIIFPLFFFSHDVFASTVVTSNSTPCTITSLLRIGSKGIEVQCLQEKVGVIADGSFGPLTKVAVMAFQSNNKLFPDGIVGPLSRVVLNGVMTNGGNYSTGCTSTMGYSPITGVKCSIISNPLLPLSSSPTVTLILSTPIITSLSVTTIQNGEQVTIYGKNFTKSNTVLLSPLDFPDQYTNLISFEGTSIQITVLTPVSEALKNIQKDNPRIHQIVINKIKAAKSKDASGWYLPATISVQNENGTSNTVSVNINVLNGV